MNDRFKFRFWNKTRKIMETFNNSPLTLGGLLLGKTMIMKSYLAQDLKTRTAN